MLSETAPSAPTRPLWRRARLWLALALVVALGAALVGSLSSAPGRPLDPGSAEAGGSRALAHVLERYGTRVVTTTGLDAVHRAGGAVLVTAPDDYSDAQLRRLAQDARPLVLLRPGSRATRAVLPGASPDPTLEPSNAPECRLAGAQAAGRVALPGNALPYDLGDRGGSRCYGGVVALRDGVVLLGAPDLLRNDRLAGRGVAALDVNLLSADRTVGTLTWLLPGADAAGSGPASVWDLFPGGVYRAFVWLIVLGLLVVLWRGRRLGGVVHESLPVVVRASELVEGHGRLYERAGARDRAAGALRAAAIARLAVRTGEPRGASAEQVAAAVSARLGAPAADVHPLLAGAVPADDAALLQLAIELDRLESAVGHPKES